MRSRGNRTRPVRRCQGRRPRRSAVGNWKAPGPRTRAGQAVHDQRQPGGGRAVGPRGLRISTSQGDQQPARDPAERRRRPARPPATRRDDLPDASARRASLGCCCAHDRSAVEVGWTVSAPCRRDESRLRLGSALRHASREQAQTDESDAFGDGHGPVERLRQDGEGGGADGAHGEERGGPPGQHAGTEERDAEDEATEQAARQPRPSPSGSGPSSRTRRVRRRARRGRRPDARPVGGGRRRASGSVPPRTGHRPAACASIAASNASPAAASPSGVSGLASSQERDGERRGRCGRGLGVAGGERACVVRPPETEVRLDQQRRDTEGLAARSHAAVDGRRCSRSETTSPGLRGTGRRRRT